MTEKLLQLNKLKLNQNISLKLQKQKHLSDVEKSLISIDESINTTGVEKFGAIGDFKLLAIHKNALKHDKEKLISKKNILIEEVKKYDIIIMSFQKEIEKYDYLIKEDKKLKIKKLIKYDEDIASEYMQSKFIKNMNLQKDNFV